MRRPRFYRWIRLRVMEGANTSRFSLRKMAALVQRGGHHGDTLAAALFLYSHENNCTDRLLSFVYDDALRAEYESVARHVGARSLERLALRGTPMYSLPPAYRQLLEDYERAYHAPERQAAEKRLLLAQTRAAVIVTGTSPAELARALHLDRANVSAFLARDDVNRLTLEDARRLAAHLAILTSAADFWEL